MSKLIHKHLATDAVETINIKDANVTAVKLAENCINNINKIDASILNVANGLVKLDSNGKVPVANLPNAIMEYQGTFDPTTTTLANGAGNADEDIGNVWRASVAGSHDFGAGAIAFEVGDYAILNSSKVWERADTSDAVTSVNSKTGAVTLITDDIAEGGTPTNKWFTDARAQSAVVTSSISNDDTTHAPSGDAVYDALLLKTNVADLSSTANGKGASLVGVEDATGVFTATTVEGVLVELDSQLTAVEGELDALNINVAAALAAEAQARSDADAALDSRIDALEGQNFENRLTTAEGKIDDLVTLSGVSANSENLGTFTGSTIADASTIKSALQALETGLEDHVGDTTGAHAASAISFVDTARYHALGDNVQSAMEGLDAAIGNIASAGQTEYTVNVGDESIVAAHFTAIDAALGARPLSTDLASTANAKGASLIGIEDAAGKITATTVEGALAELAGKAPVNHLHTLIADEVTAKAFDLPSAPNGTAIFLFPVGGIPQAYSIDFTIGGAGNKTVSWTGLGMDDLGLVAGDKIQVIYFA